MELNQKFLEEQIEIFEKWYVTSMIELIKLPIFVEQIEKELELDIDEEKRNWLKNLLDNNATQEKWHKENLENIEKILEKVYKLRK